MHKPTQSEVIGKTADDQQRNKSNITNLNANGIPLRSCCALSFYSICFSVIKACSYWNSDTLDSISEHGGIFYTQIQSSNKQHITINDFPTSLQIYDADIRVQTYNLQNRITLNCMNETCKLELQNILIKNLNANTGFIAWLSTFCASCIFHHKYKTTDFYLMMLTDNGSFDVFEKVNNVPSLIQKMMDITTKTIQSNELDCYILFLSCLTQLSKSTRQNILRKHKADAQIRVTAEKRKLNYANMEPTLKKQCLFRKAQQYRPTDPAKREKNLSHLRTNSQAWYDSMDTAKKQKRFSDNQAWYNSLNPAKKEKLLSDMQSNSKDLYHSKREKEHELNHYVTTFKRKIQEGPYYICTVCNRLLYRKTVITLQESKYDIQHLFTEKKSFVEKQYICRTCHSKVMKQQTPCQAVHNNLQVVEIPYELAVLEKLEQILIARRIVFEKNSSNAERSTEKD